MKKFLISALLTILLSAVCFFLYAGRDKDIKEITGGKNFQIGIAVLSDRGFRQSDRQLYPLASVFKLHVAAAVLHKMERENIKLDYRLPVRQSALIENTHSPMLKGRLKTDFSLSIAELLTYMLAYSDNNACDVMIEFAGGMDSVQAYVRELGFKRTFLRMTEKEMQDNPDAQKINRASPGDVARFMELILRPGFFNTTHEAFLKQVLVQTNTGEDKIKRFLPEGVIVGSKTGHGMREADGMRIAENDAAFIRLPNGQIYYLVVLIKNSYESDETNRLSIARISKYVYDQMTAERL